MKVGKAAIASSEQGYAPALGLMYITSDTYVMGSNKRFIASTLGSLFKINFYSLAVCTLLYPAVSRRGIDGCFVEGNTASKPME